MEITITKYKFHSYHKSSDEYLYVFDEKIDDVLFASVYRIFGSLEEATEVAFSLLIQSVEPFIPINSDIPIEEQYTALVENQPEIVLKYLNLQNNIIIE